MAARVDIRGLDLHSLRVAYEINEKNHISQQQVISKHRTEKSTNEELCKNKLLDQRK